MFIQVNNLNKSFHNEPVLKNIHVSIGEERQWLHY